MYVCMYVCMYVWGEGLKTKKIRINKNTYRHQTKTKEQGNKGRRKERKKRKKQKERKKKW